MPLREPVSGKLLDQPETLLFQDRAEVVSRFLSEPVAINSRRGDERTEGLSQPHESVTESVLWAALRDDLLRRPSPDAVEWVVTGRWPVAAGSGLDIQWVADGLEGLRLP